MQCPNDKTEMEKGFIGQMGQIWKGGTPSGTGIAEAISLGGKYIFAYRCPKCGKVELTTETK